MIYSSKGRVLLQDGDAYELCKCNTLHSRRKSIIDICSCTW